MKLENKNVLVTGGAGFAGSHLVEQLLSEGCKQVIVADIVYDQNSYFKRSGLDQKVTALQLDINDYDDVLDVITKNDVNIIFHLAAQAIVEVAYKNPKQTLLTNIIGTVNILEAARQASVEAVIVASSDKAYGKLSKDKYAEDDPLKGDHPYDVSKSCADLISQTYFTTYNLPVVTTRFGNIYGEGDQNKSRLIPSIIEAIAHGSTLHLRSDGSHVRDYLYVKDVAKGYIALAKNIDTTKGNSYNFGSDDTYSVLELIEKVEMILGKKVKLKINNTAKNEIPYQCLDCKKVEMAVGWKQEYNLSSTIKNIADYYGVKS